MKVIEVKTEKTKYPILIGKSILPELKKYIEGYDKILILSNVTVGDLYFKVIKRNLPEYENIEFYQIKDGEQYKNIETAMEIYDFMIDREFTRRSLIISLGGGVVCDLGGYAASTYMRGIDFIQIPTSLLAQVDASIGGKVAVNHPKGKNLIGVFNQPKMVLIDVAFLSTLPREEFLSGMGEVIKHSFVEISREYYNFLRNNAFKILQQDKETLIKMIEGSCVIKKIIVEEDETEKGIRAFLNLGHTYGHALETLYGYEHISHGEAVSKGIIFEIMLSLELGYCEPEMLKKAEELFNIYGIDSEPIYIETERFKELIKKDKKNTGSGVNFILFKDKHIVNEKLDMETALKVDRSIENRLIKAVVDIGTNSCRLFIAEVKRDGENFQIVRPLFKTLDITRLGEDVNKNGYLLEGAMQRSIDALKKFAAICSKYGVSHSLAFATSATRDSSNRDEFMARIKNETGFEISCIDGRLEAELSFLGSSTEFSEEIVIIDIGGGSTEVTLGGEKGIEYMKSFNIGAVRAAEKFFQKDDYSEKNIADCIAWVENELKEIVPFKKRRFELVGVAGTVTTNVSVAQKMVAYDSEKVHLYPLSKEELEENIRLYLSHPLEERKKIVGLEPKRADVIIAGSIILKTIMKILEKNVIIVSEKDNLEGAMKLSFGR